MGSVTDPSDYRERFQNELSRLHDLEYTQDANEIRKWANQLSDEYSTRANLVTNVRTLSRRAAVGGYPPLTEMEDAADFYELHDSVRDGTNPDVKDSGLADSTLRNVRKAARQFFRDGLDAEWHDEIEIGGPSTTNVTESDIFVAEEVSALFDAARNPRDKALMGALLATGQRISALLSLRIRDVDLEGDTGYIHLNDEAIGLKGAAGKRPLLWATEYMKNWLDVHPERGDPDAAVFCILKDQRSSDDDEQDYTRPLDPWGVNQQLRRIGKRAEVEKPVNPHNFRHSAVTRMVRDGLTDQRIKWMVGWKPDSTQFEQYAHLKEPEMIQGVLEHYDLEEPGSDIGKPKLEKCPSCGAALDSWVDPVACPGCGVSLSHKSASIVEAAESITETATEAAIESTDPEEIAGTKALREAFADPQAVQEKIAELEAKVADLEEE